MKRKRRIRRQAEPRLGWLYLSRAALDAARDRLDWDEQGVRDELGFGAIHFGYSDRFFPGTSVLLTRLRYALFIPWLYEDLQRDFRGEAFPEHQLATLEQELGVALKNYYADRGLDHRGIIGRFVVDDHPPVVLPSQIYWPSLVSWGIVARMDDGSRPSRSEVQANWGRFSPSLANQLRSEDRQVIDPPPPLFDLPKLADARREWARRRTGRGKISFFLSKAERDVLRGKLRELRRPNRADEDLSGEGVPEQGLSLFARLAGSIATVDVGAKSPWSPQIRQFADDHDKAALRRAEQAALLVQLGRGIYDALVARSRAKDDKDFTCAAEAALQTLLADKASIKRACELDFAAMADDGVKIDPNLSALLGQVQKWYANPGSVEDLRALFTDREKQKKPGKARLAKDAVERRLQWNPPMELPRDLPRPLSYRWEVVASLLTDLKYGDQP